MIKNLLEKDKISFYLKKKEAFLARICGYNEKSIKLYDDLLKHDIDKVKHIDDYMSNMCDHLNVYVLHPMICKQYDNCYSINKRKVVDYSKNIKDYKFITN